MKTAELLGAKRGAKVNVRVPDRLQKTLGGEAAVGTFLFMFNPSRTDPRDYIKRERPDLAKLAWGEEQMPTPKPGEKRRTLVRVLVKIRGKGYVMRPQDLMLVPS
jgi:hypothetical protein